jgi:hypothetical protein
MQMKDSIRVAWTITKLKVVRWLLKPLLKLHIRWETRHQRKVMPAHTEGPIGRDAIRKAVARIRPEDLDRLTSHGKLPKKHTNKGGS